MSKETMLSRRIITVICLISLLGLSSCVTKPKIIFFNDSERIYSGEKGQVITPDYSFVLMSKGKFREITTVNLTNGIYTCTKEGF